MNDIFRTVLVLSVKASWAALAVILLRFVLKNAPKWTHCLLWAVVGLRLVLPFSVESRLSLVPRQEAVRTVFFSDALFETLPESLNGSAAKSGSLWTVLTVVWVIGTAALLVYAAIAYALIYRRVAVSVCAEGNVYLCDDIDKPFVLGIFRPRICLPSGMDEEQVSYVLCHERAHLLRGDHIIKPLSFLLVAIHWFNPVLWLAYKLVGQDIELACDEKTVKAMDLSARKAYSETLLTCGMERTRLFACPVAFGEVGVQERIVSVLRYRRRTFWHTLAAAALCLMLAVSFLTDPVTARMAEAVYDGNAPEIVTKVPENSKVVGKVTSLDGLEFNTKGISVNRNKCCPFVDSAGMEMTYMFSAEKGKYEYCDSSSYGIHIYGEHLHWLGDVYTVVRCKNCGSEIAAFYVGKGTYCETLEQILNGE